MFSLILVVAAFLLCLFATFAYQTTTERGFAGRINLIAFALACYFLSILVTGFANFHYGH